MEMPPWLDEYAPQVPLNTLVERVNQIFHALNAANYDREHPEIHEQLPPIWKEMLAQLPPDRDWRVLDFGCGTGFEASQALHGLGNRVDKLVAYDLSPEMLAQCRLNVQKFGKVVFCSQIEDLGRHGPFNLLLTNSLLHHLPCIEETLKFLLPTLTDDSYWLAGHEPSNRFYMNSNCLTFLKAFNDSRQREKWLTPSRYSKKLKTYLSKLKSGGPISPYRATAIAAVEQGLFKKIPTDRIIDRIVDFHVAHSGEEVISGRGLDFENMQKELSPEWKLEWVTTYAYFGDVNPMQVSQKWTERSRQIARRYPNDGANFSTVWSRHAHARVTLPSDCVSPG